MARLPLGGRIWSATILRICDATGGKQKRKKEKRMKKLFILFLLFFTTDSFATGIGVIDNTAPCTNSTLDKYTGTANAEIDWQPNTINVTWFDGDTQLDVPSNAQSCVYDGTLTVPPAPSARPGYTFNGWKVRGLPAGYTKLEYLQFNGAQWIDTGITPNQDSRVRITVMPTSDTADTRVGGAFGGTSYTDKTFGIYFGGDKKLYFCYNSDTLILDSNGQQVEKQVNAKYFFEINKNRFYVNEQQVGSGPSVTFTAHESFRIGMMHMSTFGYPFEGFFTGRIYDFAMWDNGHLVRSMIPAKNSSNVLGMFDTVSQTFFTNAGTGTFTAGPAIQ